MSITPNDDGQIEPLDVNVPSTAGQAEQTATGLKVLLLDLDAETVRQLSDAGHQVSTGSFGAPYNYTGVRGSPYFSVVATADGSTRIVDS
jgi:hypothetical protein